MDYRTFPPHPELHSLVKCHWTLEIPAAPDPQRQRIIPDGCLEMIFILGDDIRRYTSGNEFIIQPRAMVLGQITRPFHVQPVGHVRSFAVRFYPYGFANFVALPIADLADKETPLALLFGEGPARELEREITLAMDTAKRIEAVERFLLAKLGDAAMVDGLVTATIEDLFSTGGSASIGALLEKNPSRRRQIERKFRKQVGLSPKQLGKVIRLQAALRMLLDRQSRSLTQVAYESEYYDQAHFIKDFKEFTGINPKEFLGDGRMALSSLFYKND